MDSQHTVRNISDTARWVAYFRAQETLRADSLFRDAYAERLAGEVGFQIAGQLPGGNADQWAWTMRTHLFDKFVMSEIHRGADLVLSLGAGLDARPYRMDVAATLHWVEVDLPETISYKEHVLAGEKPSCRLRRVSLDLMDVSSRRELFSELNQIAQNIVVLTEGLLIYLTSEEVISLANEMSSMPHFRSWIIDLASPGQLTLMQRTMGRELSAAGAPFKFGPPEGANFFSPLGWEPVKVEGLLKNAALLNRAPAHLLGLLPEPEGSFRRYPWTGVCLLKKR